MHSQDGSDNSRAETLAASFSEIQWAVRPTRALPTHNSTLHSISVNCGQVTFEELRAAAEYLKRNKQCGADDIPAEFLQAVTLPCSDACNWILTFFQSIWSSKCVDCSNRTTGATTPTNITTSTSSSSTTTMLTTLHHLRPPLSAQNSQQNQNQQHS